LRPAPIRRRSRRSIKLELGPTQVRAAEILLKKTLADTSEATLNVNDQRDSIEQFSDAELSAILREKIEADAEARAGEE
jgi:hypothetical protein